jgi:N-acetylmuramic acid 6-phosphate etherase
MLDKLLTEQRNPASTNLDQVSTRELVNIFVEEDRKISEAIAAAADAIAHAIDAISRRLAAGGRLFYIGAGTSGRLGVLDASECPPTFNVAPELVQGIIAGGEPALSRATEASEDDPELGAADLRSRGFHPGDVLVGIAASGRTPYVIGAIQEATRMGALTVGIACSPNSPLAEAVDIPIEVLTGPEIVTGSTRLKAGTATKLVLNMLSTGTMVKLGYVYGNLMVNVQPKNKKLVERAVRIIQQATGIEREQAEALFTESSDVRRAILMAKLGISAVEAAERLTAAGGHLRRALDEA